jgi:hypothetical protein
MINSYDIETFVDEYNKIIPYCICFLYKKKYYYFYYKEEEDIVLKSIDFIFSLDLNLKNIFYIHNLNFDGIILLTSLTLSNKYRFESFIKDNSIFVDDSYRERTSLKFNTSVLAIPSDIIDILI